MLRYYENKIFWYKFMNIIDLIMQEESDWLDFKQEWYKSNFELIHDILCMSNSLTTKERRYIIIGIENSKHNIIGVDKTSIKWTTENITQILLTYMTVIPSITLIHTNVKGKRVDILEIAPKIQDLPYILDRKGYKETLDRKNRRILQNVVYTRNNSRNTPVDQGADKLVLEQLVCRKKGLELSPIDRFNYYIKDTDKWVCPKRNEELTFYYNQSEGVGFQIFVKEEKHFSLSSYKDILNYNDFMIISALNDEVWKWKRRTSSCSIEEGFSLYHVTIKFNSTIIKEFNIVGLDLKHEPFPGYNIFFIPEFGWSCQYTKNEIINLEEYHVCQLMYKVCNETNESRNDRILDYLNWEYLKDSSAFWKKYPNRRTEQRENL